MHAIHSYVHSMRYKGIQRRWARPWEEGATNCEKITYSNGNIIPTTQNIDIITNAITNIMFSDMI